MTDIKTEACNDQQLKELLRDRTLTLLRELKVECKDLDGGEILTGTISIMINYLVSTFGTNVAEAYLQQLIDLHKAHKEYLN